MKGTFEVYRIRKYYILCGYIGYKTRKLRIAKKHANQSEWDGLPVQRNLSVTTTSIIKFITCD